MYSLGKIHGIDRDVLATLPEAGIKGYPIHEKQGTAKFIAPETSHVIHRMKLSPAGEATI
jgi:hypothetical protein